MISVGREDEVIVEPFFMGFNELWGSVSKDSRLATATVKEMQKKKYRRWIRFGTGSQEPDREPVSNYPVLKRFEEQKHGTGLDLLDILGTGTGSCQNRC